MKEQKTILDELIEEINNVPWYIKLWNKLKVYKWIVYCYLFNNRFIRKLKRK